jgi:hypothetical protein
VSLGVDDGKHRSEAAMRYNVPKFEIHMQQGARSDSRGIASLALNRSSHLPQRTDSAIEIISRRGTLGEALNGLLVTHGVENIIAAMGKTLMQECSSQRGSLEKPNERRSTLNRDRRGRLRTWNHNLSQKIIES